MGSVMGSIAIWGGVVRAGVVSGYRDMVGIER